MYDLILQVFLHFLFFWSQIVWILSFQVFQLVFLELCEIDDAGVIRVNRNSICYGLLVVIELILLVRPQWLTPLLLLFHTLKISLLIWGKIDNTWMLRVEGDTVHDEILEIVKFIHLLG